jgi:hypothetical protein
LKQKYRVSAMKRLDFEDVLKIGKGFSDVKGFLRTTGVHIPA